MTSPHADRRALATALFVAVAVAVVLVPLAAHAQPTDAQKKEAKELNDKATRLYEVGRYDEAIAEYQKVYLIVDDPVLLYNIAQSYRLWGKPEDSVRFYRNYLRRAPNAPNRADVEKKIADLEKQIDERKRSPVTPTAPPVTTPEMTAPPPPPPVVTPPPATTTSPATTVVEPPTTTVVQPVAPAAESHSGRRTGGVICVIGGVGLIVVSAISGSIAHSKSNSLQDMSSNGKQPPFDPAIEKAGKNANSVALITGVAGIASAVTGGILLLTAGSSEKPVSLYPMIGPQLAGAGARVTFR